jgi:molybdate transport system ATP-binding protein
LAGSEATLSEPQQHLSLDLRHRLGTLEINTTFHLTQPWTVLFGPSGSGKSTILRAIAGLLRPRQARITLQWDQHGTQVAVDTEARIFVPAHQRFVRWSAQRPALFPNMTVRENLRFVTPGPGPDRTLDAAIERFRLAPVADRKPATLSGGEQQRVSIARAAIASEGRLLLLDEPFTGLDAPLRDELLANLQAWLAQTKTPVLSVTHDVSEAFQLGAEVIRIHEGTVIQQGPAAVVLAQQREHLLRQLSGSLEQPHSLRTEN